METTKTFQKWSSEEDSFVDLIERVLEHLEEGEVQTFAYVARQVWFRRNKMVFDDEFASPAAVNRLSTEQKELFSLAENRPSRKRPSDTTPSVIKWERPPVGWLKMNWDTSVDQARQKIGVSIVLRNHDGEIVAAQCLTRSLLPNPTAAEAMGVWYAANMCKSMEIMEVILEGDSLEVVQALQKEGSCWSSYGQLINDAKILLHGVRSWEVRHVK
jgi:ribonuclease HI